MNNFSGFTWDATITGVGVTFKTIPETNLALQNTYLDSTIGSFCWLALFLEASPCGANRAEVILKKIRKTNLASLNTSVWILLKVVFAGQEFCQVVGYGTFRARIIVKNTLKFDFGMLEKTKTNIVYLTVVLFWLTINKSFNFRKKSKKSKFWSYL